MTQLPDISDPSFGGPFSQWLGLHYTEVTGDRVVGTWEARPDHHQPFGLVHGGVYCSVVESLASIGGQMWLHEQDREGRVVGVNNSTDFYRGVGTGAMTSTATPVHRGRSQQVWVVETHDESGRLLSRGQVRLQNLDA